MKRILFTSAPLLGIFGKVSPSLAQVPSLPASSCPKVGLPAAALGQPMNEECCCEVIGAEEPGSPRAWLQGEYLLWWLRQYNVPPLATTGPADVFAPGALGQPGTTVLLGGGNRDNEAFQGFRIRGGFWFDDDQQHGLELGWFWLAPQHDTAIVGPGPSGVLARPFIAGNFAGASFSQIAAFPGLSDATINVSSRTSLWGA